MIASDCILSRLVSAHLLDDHTATWRAIPRLFRSDVTGDDSDPVSEVVVLDCCLHQPDVFTFQEYNDSEVLYHSADGTVCHLWPLI